MSDQSFDLNDSEFLALLADMAESYAAAPHQSLAWTRAYGNLASAASLLAYMLRQATLTVDVKETTK